MSRQARHIARARRRAKLRRKVSSILTAWNETYMKRIVGLILRNAVLWVWCSYILAWFGRYEIAQQLSIAAVTSIVSVVLTYALKSGVENVSKYGWRGKVGVKQSDNEGEVVLIGADSEEVSSVGLDAEGIGEDSAGGDDGAL